MIDFIECIAEGHVAVC